MNWYVDPTASPRYYGNISEYLTAWRNIADAVSDNSLVSMYWSPNNLGGHPATDLDEWYPGDDVVDLVGIDCYPQATNETFDWCYRDFYNHFAVAKGKPFAIGETGADAELKDWWLKELVSQSRAEYPLYVSMSWFEYLRSDVDFRVVMADQQELARTKTTLGLRNSTLSN